MWSVEVEADFSKKGNASLADGVNLAFAAKVKISVMSFLRRRLLQRAKGKCGIVVVQGHTNRIVTSCEFYTTKN